MTVALAVTVQPVYASWMQTETVQPQHGRFGPPLPWDLCHGMVQPAMATQRRHTSPSPTVSTEHPQPISRPVVSCPFSPDAASSSPGETCGWPTLQTSSPWHACFIAALCYNSSTTPPKANWPPAPAPPPLRLTVLLPAHRVHVEPRPPDFEESSQFSGAAAGKDGIRQGRSVRSPPARTPPHHHHARADAGKVMLMFWSLVLGQPVWGLQSASIRLWVSMNV